MFTQDRSAEKTRPDMKALRRILYALFFSAVLCFAICVTLVLRQGHITPALHKPVHRCTCAVCPR
jgi:hypothetical protein